MDKDLLLPRSYASFSLDAHLETEILMLHIFPGIRPEMVHYLLDYPDLRGVILLTFGSGNAPDSAEFLAAIEHVIARDIPVHQRGGQPGRLPGQRVAPARRGDQRARHDQRSSSGQDDAPARTPLRSG